MLFTKEGSDDYVQYSSGRKNCHGMVVRMSLMPRHDLISLLFAMLDADGGDMVKMEVIVDKHGVKPFVFALVPAKKAKRSKSRQTIYETLGRRLRLLVSQSRTSCSPTAQRSFLRY